ncbi:S-adenosylmethionine mitochondrial carrier protein [Lingula anatina]|uniref:S-adenosylmethionine mitochondrial carrier protein n=1 Tax=Lingula anatina TaxID=7574 RepID=A0A2R2MQU4_LINAN|nr:S-adenosylmethionine mitochondrial carrier protein [Lingula anatina]|eukprot:XP_023932372.1 S-adenosylmethionine mitochondrial carrier protein [Lingula anatina]
MGDLGSKAECHYPAIFYAGAAAGLCVDLALFPIDTVKTRLQSEQGFFKTGGFRGIYAGIGATAVGSAPGSALFFVSYEAVKDSLGRRLETEHLQPAVHMTAAACGEVAGCLARVPTEVVKQRAQANPSARVLDIFRTTLQQEGIRGLYRGYTTTVLREIPFSFIQFPLWEIMKKSWSRRQGASVNPWQSSICGAISGAIAASVTTPLDVAKTRIMLAEHGSCLASGSLLFALKQVYGEKGTRGLFAGVVPRTLWIAIGGGIFLGVYDKVKLIIGAAIDEER